MWAIYVPCAGVTYLDITKILDQRPDGHMPKDCGHWCLPGPYDIVARLLYNALIGQVDVPVARFGCASNFDGKKPCCRRPNSWNSAKKVYNCQ